MPGLIVHEWLEPAGGAERVVDAFMETFPDADLKVLWNDDPHRYGQRQPWETWLARTAFRKSKAAALPLMPFTWRIESERGHDWALVSSHLFAHHVNVIDAPKYVYAHTPARYIWEPDLDQRGAHPIARAASAMLKPLDRRRAAEARGIAANSEFTRARIQRAWGRDARVIYPPVATSKLVKRSDWSSGLSAVEIETLRRLPTGFVLGASRMVPYKRLDQVIDVGVAARMPIVIAGSGPERGRLSQHAESKGASVTFIDRPSDGLLRALYAAADAFIFPPVEDFGIMPVEAMACGTPVIVNARGGAAESAQIVGGGRAVDFDSDIDWVEVIHSLTEIDKTQMRANTEMFDTGTFQSKIRDWVEEN